MSICRLSAASAVEEALARKLPALLEERPVALDLLKRYDKGFSCVSAFRLCSPHAFVSGISGCGSFCFKFDARFDEETRAR